MAAAVKTFRRVEIAESAALSGRVVLGDGVPVALEMPAEWTDASITFLGSHSATGTLKNVYDAEGQEVKLTVDDGQFIVLNPLIFAGFGSIQLRSGTAETPADQSAARVLYLVIKEF